MKWKLGDLYLGKQQYRCFMDYLAALQQEAVDMCKGLKQVGWSLFSLCFSIVMFPLLYVIGIVYTNLFYKEY